MFFALFTPETLRKYPPIGMMQRQCTESFRIPDSSVIVEKGTYVFIPVYGLHHDPAYFPEPEKFIPERFIEKQSITPYTYLPFGDGPRICIGKILIFLKYFEFQVEVGRKKCRSQYEMLNKVFISLIRTIIKIFFLKKKKKLRSFLNQINECFVRSFERADKN